MALAVPLSRFTSRVGGGSAFYVRPHMSATYYFGLLALLAVMLLILSPNLRQLLATGICLWTWGFCLIISGVVGECIGSWYGSHVLRGHFFDSGFLQNLLVGYGMIACVAVLTFVLSYRFAAYSMFLMIERSRKVELAKPSAKLGAFLAVASPFAIDYIISAFRMSR